MERLTERVGKYIRVIGCSTLYCSSPTKRARAQNAIIKLAEIEDRMEYGELVEVVECDKCTMYDTVNCPCATRQVREKSTFYLTSGRVHFCSWGERKANNG